MTTSQARRPENVAVIGAGNLGSALALSFADHGFSTRLGARKPDKLDYNAQYLSITDYASAIDDADVIVLTLADSYINEVCQALSPVMKPNCTVLHCSGALDSEQLIAAKQQGCNTASAHPLNTFPNPQAAIQTLREQHHNTFLFCEGDAPALTVCSDVFQQLGFTVSAIDKAAKPLYHAAGVFACNYLNALMELSLQTAGAAGLGRTQYWQAIQPLILATLGNIDERGTAASLSGPIARGDSETISKHLVELGKSLPGAVASYAELGKHALNLAAQRGELSQTTLEQLAVLLDSNS